jgi:hypothetical protein
VDKFSEIFKVTVAVFHGIISTWLFVEFSELTVSESGFLILVAFFTIANVIIWNGILSAFQRIKPRRGRGRSNAAPNLSPTDIAGLRYRGWDVAGLLVVSVSVGLLVAYGQRKDMVLRVASIVPVWERTSSDTPFMLLLSRATRQTIGEIDGRDVAIVRAAAGKAYLRIFVKDTRVAYEGYPGVAANKRDPREIILTPACRLFFDSTDPAKISAVQRIDGPGVFIRLTDVPAIEIIDRHQSACAKLHDDLARSVNPGP